MKIHLLLLSFALLFPTERAISALSEEKADFHEEHIQRGLNRYYLPSDHPMKPILDEIFTKPGILANQESFTQAGFKILLYKRSSHASAHWVLASHPRVPGYLFKVFLNDEKKLKKNEASSQLLERCKGAERIRTLIQKKRLRHFVVPDKWLYPVPLDPFSDEIQQPFILMVTEMKLFSFSESKARWKKAIKEELDELYCILSHGYSSVFLPGNTPYTKSGKFACVDTEGGIRNLDLRRVRRFLSQEQQKYWDHLRHAKPQRVSKD